jgi:hypothetical protein
VRRLVQDDLFIVAFLLYSALFIYRTSFVVGGERYFSLFDDAMVSMRYARNFAHGYGLVWNPGGARVEGYTNPLWVLYMSLVHLLPIAASKVSLAVQVTAAVLLALNLVFVRRIALALSNGSRAVAFGALALTASYLPINNWSLQGMEVSVLVVLITVCLWLAIRGIDTARFDGRLYVLLGIGMLVRPDGAVPLAAFLAFMLIADRRHRRRHLLWGVVALAIAGGVQTLFRLGYYGSVLPNTYYLKMTGVPMWLRMSRGAYVLLQFVWRANPLWFALAFAAAVLGRDRRVRLLLWVFVAQAAYSVYVGGDAWEYWGGSNRYISIAMPAFFIVLSCALHDLTIAFAGTVRASRPRPAAGPDAATAWMFTALVAYAVFNMNSISGIGAWSEALLIRPPLHSGNGEENQQDVEEALLLRTATTGDARVAVVRAGTIPYFSDRYSIDLLGKNDPHVARGPAHVRSGLRHVLDFRPGHMKFDFAYSIGVERPDVVVQLRDRVEEALPLLGDYTAVLLNRDCAYVRGGSARVERRRLPSDRCAR